MLLNYYHIRLYTLTFMIERDYNFFRSTKKRSRYRCAKIYLVLAIYIRKLKLCTKTKCVHSKVKKKNLGQ